jgi:hypothetical protein
MTNIQTSGSFPNSEKPFQPQPIPEAPKSELAARVILNAVDFEKIINQENDQLHTPEFQNFLRTKNIPFNKGFVPVSVDGNLMEMNTNENDFGTIQKNKKNNIL